MQFSSAAVSPAQERLIHRTPKTKNRFKDRPSKTDQHKMYQVLHHQQKHRHHPHPAPSESHHHLIESDLDGDRAHGSGVTSQLISSVAAPAQILLKSQPPGTHAETSLMNQTGPDGKREKLEENNPAASTSKFWYQEDFVIGDRIDSALNEKPCLKLNISGAKFQILRSRLLKFPETRLGKLAAVTSEQQADKLCDYLMYKTEEYYFDRSPGAFDAVANFYRQETLHFPDTVCPNSFFEEMRYWGIDRGRVASCCELKMHLAEIEENRKHETHHHQNHCPKNEPNGVLETGLGHGRKTEGQSCCSRESLWELLEQPASSWFAFTFTIISVSFVVATVVILILGSMPEFRKTTIAQASGNSTETLSIDKIDEGLEIADAVCVAWFTLEILLRLWSCPNRLRFIRSPLCLIDFGAVVPFYVELGMSFVGVESKAFADLRKSLLMIRILRALRVMRVLRVLKVARYSRGFQSVGATLRKSWKELMMLVMFMFTTNIIFSTVIYFIEGDDYAGSKFTSIPAASWWCIITMTTVGYGDVFPHTVGGKIVAVVVSISGIILLAFPISVIVEHFHEEYTGDANKEEDKQSQSSQPQVPHPAGSMEAAPLALALVRANATLAQMVTKSLVLPNASDPFDLAALMTAPLAPERTKRRRHRRGFKL